MREEDNSKLDELELRILRYIFQVLHHPTRRDIEAFFFPTGPRKTKYLERKLQHLVEQKYISYQLLERDTLPARERGYYLLIRGSRAIGVELKRNHSKYQKKKGYEVKKAKTELTILAHRQKWQIASQEDTCKSLIIVHIQSILFSQRRTSLISDILTILPKQIKPDLVIKTQDEVFICIIGHPAGEANFFRRREEKYEHCKNFFKFIVIVLNERQWIQAMKGLKGECSYLSEKGSIDNSKTFLIFRIDQIGQIPPLR